MFVQIVLIQRFTLFIGYPAGRTTTISACFASLPAAVWLPVPVKSHFRLQPAILTVSAFIMLYVLVLPPIFRALLGLDDALRVVVGVMLIAPSPSSWACRFSHRYPSGRT